MSTEPVTTEDLVRRYESLVQETERRHSDREHGYQVLLEKYQDDHKMLGEGYASLNERIDRLDQKVDQKFGELSHRVDVLSVRVDSVATTVAKMDGRLKQVEHHLGLNGSGKKPVVNNARPKKNSSSRK